MQIPDSYKALANSIERALRTEIAPRREMPELVTSVEDVLLREACAGERKLAYLRLTVAAIALGLAAWVITFGGRPESAWQNLAGLVLCVVWELGALSVVAALSRGWYHPQIRYAAPAIDAIMIWGIVLLHSNQIGDVQTPAAIVGLDVVLCGFLAVSGALRLSRGAAQVSTALALAVFLFAARVDRLPLVLTIVIGLGLLAMGVLSVEVTTLVRRVATNEVKRLVFAKMYEHERQAVDAREEVLKIVSHDLRNPLNTISMSASLMLDIPLPDAQRAKQLHTIKRAGERMNRLIQDLLDVAKVEAGRLGITPKPVSVAALLSEAEEMLRPLATERALTLEVIASDGLPTITVDVGRVLQLLSNLVGNAIKFTPAGGRITIRAEATDASVQFSVADTGKGIPAEQLESVFGRLWQGDPNDRRGIGLGLAISKGIVEAHSGRIWLESELGTGTTFHFTLGDEVKTREAPVGRHGNDAREQIGTAL
jgi:signal transduction histidine kinase